MLSPLYETKCPLGHGHLSSTGLHLDIAFFAPFWVINWASLFIMLQLNLYPLLFLPTTFKSLSHMNNFYQIRFISVLEKSLKGESWRQTDWQTYSIINSFGYKQNHYKSCLWSSRYSSQYHIVISVLIYNITSNITKLLIHVYSF